MANQKSIDMANLALAISENNKKLKEYVQSSDQTIQEQVNALGQNINNHFAFGEVSVGGTTLKANEKMDTLIIKAGENVTLTPNAETNEIEIKSKDTKYSHPNSGVSAGTYRSVTVNEQGHVVSGTNPTTLVEYGITDAENKGAANAATSAHNTNTDAHNDIRELITQLTNKYNALANSDDTTLDQMKEVVSYIKANRTLIESITTNKVNVSDIIDNLTTNVSNKPLSAAQGVALKALIDALQTSVNTLNNHTTNTEVHVTASDKSNWNDANSKKHSHSNKSILDKVTQTLLDAWDSAVTHISDTVKHITSSERTLWNTVSNKADASHSHGSINSIIFADSEPETVEVGQLVMVFEEE